MDVVKQEGSKTQTRRIFLLSLIGFVVSPLVPTYFWVVVEVEICY